MHRYPAKVLLFGEHVLLLGATALAVPAPAFGLTPAWQTPETPPVLRFREKLADFANSDALASVEGLDTGSFKNDLAAGLYFASNIPAGYGLGSSGALCAAVYDRYCRKKTGDPVRLKALFAGMERFFHGSSSGIDPLTSYLNKPVVIRNKNDVSVAEPRPWPDAPLVFLLDTRQARQTAPMVQWFVGQNQQRAFSEKLHGEFLPAHEAMVRAWLEADEAAFRRSLRAVSGFQLEHFGPMIPDAIRGLWAEALAGDDVVLKICGAGGGGYALGFARDRQSAERATAGFSLVYPFDEKRPETRHG